MNGDFLVQYKDNEPLTSKKMVDFLVILMCDNFFNFIEQDIEVNLTIYDDPKEKEKFILSCILGFHMAALSNVFKLQKIDNEKNLTILLDSFCEATYLHSGIKFSYTIDENSV